MAKANDAAAAARAIIQDIRKGIFAPVYLLMGEEPYYVDMVTEAILANALADDERDFNQLVCYGADLTGEDIISNARRYPMFAERSVVVVKEAQAVKGLDTLSIYTEAPLDSTVLVLVYRGSCDKRKALYKSIQKHGVVLESVPVKDYAMASWIESFYADKGLAIDGDAASLLAESAGTDLGRVASETEKMLRNLPEGTTRITAKDIETNVGISREFSIFELTRQLSYRQIPQALRTASYVASAAKFAMPMATAMLYMHFNRILRYNALLLRGINPSTDEKVRATGAAPFALKEYETAARNYPLRKCMAIIALIRDYDFKGKGGDTGEATPKELFIELITKILA